MSDKCVTVNTLSNLIQSEIADFFAGFGGPGEPDIQSGEAQRQLTERVLDLLRKEREAAVPVAVRWRWINYYDGPGQWWYSDPKHFAEIKRSAERECGLVYSDPPVQSAPSITHLRQLVDVVWNAATESDEVPSTNYADQLICAVNWDGIGEAHSYTAAKLKGAQAQMACILQDLDLPDNAPFVDILNAIHELKHTAPPAQPIMVPDEREAFNAWNNDIECPLAGRDAKTAAWLGWSRRAAMLNQAPVKQPASKDE